MCDLTPDPTLNIDNNNDGSLYIRADSIPAKGNFFACTRENNRGTTKLYFYYHYPHLI